MSQVISSEVLARKPKKRVEWVLKRLKDELSAPGTNRDIIYEVLTRKEGRAFSNELPGTDAQRVYAATMQTLSAFTTRQQRVLQSASFVLRQLHDQEQERLAGLLSPPVVREVPKPVKTVASVGTPPGPPPPKAATSNRNAGKDLNATSKREVTSLTQSLQSDLELLRGAVSTAKEASARREEAVIKPRRRGRRSASDGSEDEATDNMFSLVSPPRGEPKKESREKSENIVEVAPAPSSSSTAPVAQRPKKEDEEFQVGLSLWYGKSSESKPPEHVTLVKVHYEDYPPYYTIRMADGREKQTVRDNLAKTREDIQAALDAVTSSASASGSKANADTQDAVDVAKEPEKVEDSIDLEESLKKSLEEALKKDKDKDEEIKAPAKADAVEDFLAPDEFDLNSPGCSPPPASPKLLQSPGCTPPGTPELKQSPGCSPPLASPDVLETKVTPEDALAEASVASKLAMEDKETTDKAESSTLDKKKDSSEEPKLASDDAVKSDDTQAAHDAIPEQSEQAQSENSTQVTVNPEDTSGPDSRQQEQLDASKEEVASKSRALAEERAQVPHSDQENGGNDASCAATSPQVGKRGQEENQPTEVVRSQDIFSRRQVPEIYKNKKRREDRDSTTRVRRHEETSRKHGRRRDTQDKTVKAKRREETSRKHRSKDAKHRDSDGRKRRRRRETEEEEEEEESHRSPSKKRALPPPAAVPQISGSPFETDPHSSTSSKLKRSTQACVFSTSNQTPALAPPPPPQRSAPLPRDSRETKKRVLSSSSMRPVRLRPSGGVGCTSRSRSREALRTRKQSAKTSIRPSLAAGNPSSKLHSHTSPESSQWSPEKRKKEILRRQLEQKTREVQSLRNKLLSKRLEQSSMANKVVSIPATTPNLIPKPPRSTIVPALPSASSNTNTFNPPPPLKQALGGSTSSIIAGLENREVLSTMQEGALPTQSDPSVDVRAPAPSFARGHTNTTVVEVDVRDEQHVQRRAKAPEVCWDLRRNISSGVNSKVHLVPHESKLQLDEKKKKLQELMQKQRSLAASKVAHAESQVPAVIDLS